MKNKKIIALLGILILTFAVMPYFLGNVAKDNISRQAEEISKIPGYRLEIRDYDQGWFSSRATLAYGFDEHTLKVMQGSETDSAFDKNLFSVLQQGLVFDVNIAHGPVSFQNGIDFALLTMTGKLRDIELEAYREFKEKSKIDSLAHLKAKISYGGDTTLNIHNPAFQVDYALKADQKITIESTGIDMEVTLNAAMYEYKASASLEQINLHNETGNLTVNKVKIQASGEKINDYLWAGKGLSSVNQFSFNGPNDVTFSVENLTNDYELDKESETNLTFHWQSTLKTLSAPDFALKDTQLDLRFNHLDIEAITDYVQSIRAMYEESEQSPKTPLEVATKTTEIASRVGEKILKNSPELIIKNLSFTLNGGNFIGNSTTQFIGDSLQSLQELSNSKALNEKLVSSANIHFDKNLAIAITTLGLKKQMAAGGMDIKSLPPEQLEQMVNVQAGTFLQTFVNQGYLSHDNDQYFTTFEMKDGKRLINGKDLPIPGM